MRIEQSVSLLNVVEHSKERGSSVIPSREWFPGCSDDFSCHRAVLDENDASKLVLWWEFQNHTRDGSCLLCDLLSSARDLLRVKSFLQVEKTNEMPKFDLGTALNMELVLVTENLECDWLYIIDGNHRTMARAIENKSFQGVPVFVCCHPRMERWEYIPEYHKKLLNSKKRHG